MKLPVVFGIVFCFLLSVSYNPIHAQSSVRTFYKDHKKKEGVFNMKLPGWLIWLGGGIVYNSINDEDAQAVMKLLKKVKKTRIMVSENPGVISGAEVQTFIHDVRQDDFEELIYVKSEGTLVNIIGRSNPRKLKDLVLVVQDEGDFVYLSMKTNIKMKHINQLLRHFLEEVPALKEVERKRKEREKKKKKSKIPQA